MEMLDADAQEATKGEEVVWTQTRQAAHQERETMWRGEDLSPGTWACDPPHTPQTRWWVWEGSFMSSQFRFLAGGSSL